MKIYRNLFYLSIFLLGIALFFIFWTTNSYSPLFDASFVLSLFIGGVFLLVCLDKFISIVQEDEGANNETTKIEQVRESEG